MYSSTPITSPVISFFFFNDTATTEIYTLSLHDALPISTGPRARPCTSRRLPRPLADHRGSRADDRRRPRLDRKSTRLNSSHVRISYAVFCLKKKNKRLNHHYVSTQLNLINICTRDAFDC